MGVMTTPAPDMRAVLREARDAIASLPPDALGIGGEGETHWSIRDELMARIDAALAAPPSPPAAPGAREAREVAVAAIQALRAADAALSMLDRVKMYGAADAVRSEAERARGLIADALDAPYGPPPAAPPQEGGSDGE